MSTWQSNSQTPSTNNSSAMASPTRLEIFVMTSSDTTRCASASAPQFRHIVNRMRTAEEDLRYHVEGHRDFRQFAELINEARQIFVKWGTGHYGSERVRGLRKQLFEAQIAEAEQCLEKQRTCDDALIVSCTAGNGYDYLAEAIADYLGQSRSKSWTIDDIIRVARSARRSPR
jgi:hypothetical protein